MQLTIQPTFRSNLVIKDTSVSELLIPNYKNPQTKEECELVKPTCPSFLQGNQIDESVGRRASNFTCFQLLALDIDKTNYETFKDAVDELLSIADDVGLLRYEFYIYETISSAFSKYCKLRIVFPIIREDDFRLVRLSQTIISKQLDLPLDKATQDPSRLFLLPTNDNIFHNTGDKLNLFREFKDEYYKQLRKDERKRIKQEKEKAKKKEGPKYNMTREVAQKFINNSKFNNQFVEGQRYHIASRYLYSYYMKWQEDEITRESFELLVEVFGEILYERWNDPIIGKMLKSILDK